MNARLTFLGAAGNVTGSRYLLETNGLRLLIECGLYQEREFTSRNWEPLGVPPRTIDAVLLTHAHVDHCGLLPKLVRDGFRGQVYCTQATAEIAKIILLDSAHLQEEDARIKQKRHERDGKRGRYPEVPLYTADDAKLAFPLFVPVEYGQNVQLGTDVSATFHDAGHVLGSSMIRIAITQGTQRRTILFPGDIGRQSTPILRDPTIFEEIDYALVESTYGDRLHDRAEDVGEKLADIINSTRQAGGNIIVPSFALERSQEILYYMSKLLARDRIPHIMVFLDSPMAVSITEVFRRHPELFDPEMSRLLNGRNSPFDFPGLNMVQTTDESKSLNHIAGTVMIISGAGMCNGGRIKHHLVTNISRPESTILFAGYQAMGTLGRQIVDGAESVRILGQQYPVRARIVQLSGLSAHADRNELLGWLEHLKRPPRRLFIIHGEPEAAQSFAQFLQEKTGWNVDVPRYGTKVILNVRKPKTYFLTHW